MNEAHPFIIEKFGFVPKAVDWGIRKMVFHRLEMKADHEGVPFDEDAAWEIATQKMIEVRDLRLDALETELKEGGA